MKVRGEGRDTRGYSLVELAVAMVLMFMMAGMAYGTYRFLMRWSAAWEEKVSLERAVHGVSVQLDSDLYEARRVHVLDGRWEIISDRRSIITYEYQDRSLYRNKVPMSVPSLWITNFAMSVEEELVTVDVTVAGSRSSYSFQVVVRLRYPEAWDSPP